MFDLRQNVEKVDLLSKINKVCLEVSAIKIEMLESLDSTEENEKIKKLLQDFIEETKSFEELDHFRKTKGEDQIQALIDTGFLILSKK
jgi:glutamate synthase domain-containing protein 3